MPEITLALEVPETAGVEQVRRLIQDALGEKGSVQLGSVPEIPKGGIEPPAYLVTGIVVCDEPASDCVEAIVEKLVDYEVDESGATSAAAHLKIKPAA